jgi:Domain of unknown function (DUF6894)
MKQWRLINLWPGRRIPMPMYYFHLRDQDHITDVDGTDLADIDAAREHADTVARELTFKTTGILGEEWSKWTMVVHDGDGLELFSFGMSTMGNGK